MSTDKPDTRPSQTEFAKKLGVKRQAVNNAVRKGLLVKHGEGRAAYIDMACPMTQAYIKNASVNRHRGKSSGGTRTPREPRSKPDKAPPKKKAPEPAPPSPEAIASADAYNDKQLIERRKLMEQIEKLELDNRETRKELISRKPVQAFIDKLYAVHNGQLKTHGLRASSDVAAIFGIEDDALIRKACDKIDKDMLSVLKQIKREMNMFLKKIGAEQITDSQAA